MYIIQLGKKVRTIVETTIDKPLNEILITPEDGKLFIGEKLHLEFKDAITAGGEPAVFVWNGENDNGQFLKNRFIFYKNRNNRYIRP